jgi:hypothetical protein
MPSKFLNIHSKPWKEDKVMGAFLSLILNQDVEKKDLDE